MRKILNSKSFCFFLTVLFLTNSFAIAQEKGTKKAEFFPEKVIITEINEKGESKKEEILAPKGYTAIRGDGFTDAFAFSKFDRSREKEQTLPVVNLSYKALHHYAITYVGKDTIQLPDQVFATVDHFSVYVKETDDPQDKRDVWIDDRGFLVLSTFISLKEGYWMGAGFSYQEAYDKDKNNGVIFDLHNGQYVGSTKWEVVDWGKDFFNIKLESFLTKKMGGFSMSVEYSLDKSFNPKSYEEHWLTPSE